MPYARTSLRAEKAALREQMRSLGFGSREIAVEFARQYRMRPRAAWREALGWSLTQAAERINTYAGQTGLDPAARSSMTGPHLCEAESWPGQGAVPTGRKPQPYLLALLAAVYGATVTELIDVADRTHLPPGDLLVLEKYSQNPPLAVNHPPAPPAGRYPPATLVLPAAVSATTPPGAAVAAIVRPGASMSGTVPPGAAGPAAARPAAGQLIVREPSGSAADLASWTEPLAMLPASAAVVPAAGVAYRGGQEPGMPGSLIEREVLMAAHEGSDHAERAEQRDIGEATLEQLRADVVRLSEDYLTGEPFVLLQEMRRVRNRIYAALDRRLWPRDTADLYLLAGCLSGLMASAANNLGFPQAAEEMIRTGWAYATVIDHRPLMAWLRMDAAYAAFWAGRPRQSHDLAQMSLEHLDTGQNAAQTHLHRGLASARLGNAEVARRAITAAQEAREHERPDDLLEIGGEFGFSRASQHYYAGFALSEIPDGTAAAISELEQATAQYEAGPGSREHHSHRLRMLAHTDLATARLRAGQLDAALVALDPVLALSTASRTVLLSQRLAVVRAELARSRYQGSPQASHLDQRIEDFASDTIAGTLRNLPASPA